jgi:hypothetical protein
VGHESLALAEDIITQSTGSLSLRTLCGSFSTPTGEDISLHFSIEGLFREAFHMLPTYRHYPSASAVIAL